jgi:hypothetical protein
MITKYASATFTCAAGLTGIIGNTHDATNPGVSGITLLGWGALLAVFLGFVVIVLETYRDQRKIHWQIQQKAKVRDIANRQIVDAVMHLLNPFRILLSQEIRGKAKDVEIGFEELDKSARYIVDLLSNPAVQSEFERVDLRATPNVAPPIVWWEYFAKCAVEARDLLNQAAAKYSGYLTPDSLVALEELRADSVVSFRLTHLGELVSMNEQIKPFPLSHAFGGRSEYAEFETMLCRVRNVLAHTENKQSIA